MDGPERRGRPGNGIRTLAVRLRRTSWALAVRSVNFAQCYVETRGWVRCSQLWVVADNEHREDASTASGTRETVESAPILDPGILVLSYALSCLSASGCEGDFHQPTVTGSGPAAAWHLALAWVNTILGNINHPLHGTHRHVSSRHLP